MLSYRRETALQGGLVMAQSGRLELGSNIYGHYRSIFNHCDVIGRQSNRIRWEKTPNKGNYAGSSKVIDFGINRKLVCNFLLVINSNWHPISYRFRVIAAYCSNFRHFAFFESLFRGLRDNVHCSSWAHWKACSGLPITVTSNWTCFAMCYGWGTTGGNRS